MRNLTVLQNPAFRVYAAGLNDLLEHEGGEPVACTDRVAEVRFKSGVRKCPLSGEETVRG